MNYSLVKNPNIILRSDGLNIPVDESNLDYCAYCEWVAAGNTATPYDDTADLIAACESEALSRLQDTDYTQEADVLDVARNPHLLNEPAFADYRSTVRCLMLMPVTNPVWPEKPAAIWSAME